VSKKLLQKQKEAEEKEEAERVFLENKLSEGKTVPVNPIYRKTSENRSSVKKLSPDFSRGVTHR